MTPEKMAWLIPALPLLGFAINLFFGRRLPKLIVSAVAVGTVAGSFALACIVYADLVRFGGGHLISRLPAWETWITVPGVGGTNYLEVMLPLELLIDTLSGTMMLVVTGVGMLIHLYSVGYMGEDKRYSRYMSYLNLFTFFMLILILGKNLMVMFVGWEGVGLCSYLLIGFWFEKMENAKAGLKAFVTNRVGDFGFTVGLLALFVSVGHVTGEWTLDTERLKHVLESGAFEVGDVWLTAVGVLLFVGACGKSAQIPLYVWLPDAMAGPTPVSALIHAATMVTAGVYMIARMHPLYLMAPAAMNVIAVVGGLTALFAATIGVCQNDIKKVLAYSTVSQLGFMFAGLGVGAWIAGIYHVVTHAFFKACLFLGSGSVIMGTHHEQDIRKMGGLRKYMPITFFTFAIATLAIAGVPGLSGFFSKDAIIGGSLERGGLVGWFVGSMLVIAAGFTAFYMTRLLIMTFFGEYRGGHDEHHDDDHGHDHGHEKHTPKESPWTMWLPLAVLAILSIAGGYLGIDKLIGRTLPEQGAAHAKKKVMTAAEFKEAHKPEKKEEHHGHGAHTIAMALSIGAAAIGIGLAAFIYHVRKGAPAKAFAEKHRDLYQLVLDKYRVDEAYQASVIDPVIDGGVALGRFDNAVVDGAVNATAAAGANASQDTGYFDNEVVDGAVNATADAVLAAGGSVRKAQTGNIKAYVAVAVIGGLFVIAFFSLYVMYVKKGSPF